MPPETPADGFRHGLPPARKRFGQHFLKDRRAIERIAALVQPQSGEALLEIGPGRGALTRPLLARDDRLLVVEIDRGMAAYLRQHLDHPGLQVIEGDILKLDLGQVKDGVGAQRLLIVGNLPYNITAPLLFRLLEQRQHLSRAVVMVQREVAQRLTAGPGSRAYSTLSVFLGMWAQMRPCLQVENRAFRPVPKVHSTVVELVFRPQPLCQVQDEALFEKLVRAAFSQRRKTLRNALGAVWGAEKERLEAAAKTAGIDLGRRAETVSIEEFGGFSDALAAGEAP